MNMFEEALRNRFRYPSEKGLVTTEDLLSLPLTTRNPVGVSLEGTAKAIARKLKEEGEESFVETNTDTRDLLTKKLDILRHVIAIRKAEVEATRNAMARAAEKQELLGILHGKKTEELGKLTVEELEAKIAAL